MPTAQFLTACKQAVIRLILQGKFGAATDHEHGYATCLYLTDEGDSCIVGLLLRNAGMLPNSLPESGSVTDVLNHRLEAHHPDTLRTLADTFQEDGPWDPLQMSEAVDMLRCMQRIHDDAATLYLNREAAGEPGRWLLALCDALATTPESDPGRSIFWQALPLQVAHHLIHSAVKVIEQGWFGAIIYDDVPTYQVSCRYLDPETGRRCIVGHLLSWLDVPDSEVMSRTVTATSLFTHQPGGVLADPLDAPRYPEQIVPTAFRARFERDTTRDDVLLMQYCQRIHDMAAEQSYTDDPARTKEGMLAALEWALTQRCEVVGLSEEQHTVFQQLARLVWRSAIEQAQVNQAKKV